MQTIMKEVDVLAAFFDDSALLRSPEHSALLVSLLAELRPCNFNLSWDNARLDPVRVCRGGGGGGDCQLHAHGMWT